MFWGEEAQWWSDKWPKVTREPIFSVLVWMSNKASVASAGAWVEMYTAAGGVSVLTNPCHSHA